LPHIKGDLNKINIDPAKRDAIVARYGGASDDVLSAQASHV
jgi:alkane 1-monooxygenase